MQWSTKTAVRISSRLSQGITRYLVWHCVSLKSMRKMERIQERALRFVFKGLITLVRDMTADTRGPRSGKLWLHFTRAEPEWFVVIAFYEIFAWDLTCFSRHIPSELWSNTIITCLINKTLIHVTPSAHFGRETNFNFLVQLTQSSRAEKSNKVSQTNIDIQMLYFWSETYGRSH